MIEWMAESETGGRKGRKLARHDLLDPGVMDAIARQFGRGAHKYGDRNYQLGYNWSLSYAAAQRHLNSFWGGEDWDQDPFWELEGLGTPHHLDAAIFHLMALREFIDKHPEYDDRATKSTTKSRGNKSETGTHQGADGRTAVTEQAETGTGDAEQKREAGYSLPGQRESDRRVSGIPASRWQLP